jgi:hypothetical protein
MSPSTKVSGLTVPGDYLFTVTAVDRTNAPRRNVRTTLK